MAAADSGFFGDKLLEIECTLEAETSVSNLTQYKLFIVDDKNNTPFGVNFSFNTLDTSEWSTWQKNNCLNVKI